MRVIYIRGHERDLGGTIHHHAGQPWGLMIVLVFLLLHFLRSIMAVFYSGLVQLLMLLYKQLIFNHRSLSRAGERPRVNFSVFKHIVNEDAKKKD